MFSIERRLETARAIAFIYSPLIESIVIVPGNCRCRECGRLGIGLEDVVDADIRLN